MRVMAVGKLRKFRSGARFLSVLSAVFLTAVSVMRGRELCLCEVGAADECLPGHCLTCEPHPHVCADDACSSASLSQAECSHVLIDGLDLFSDDDSSLSSADVVVSLLPPFAEYGFTFAFDTLPPATAPPLGAVYRVYLDRALLRS